MVRWLFTFSLLSCVAEASLSPRAYNPLPVGSITPKGWMLEQLKLQAEGLTGHLAQFWNDVMNSMWIGGGGDGGLHERVPYWLNGIVPLAFLLKNAGIDEFAPVTGIYKAPWGRAFDPEYAVCAPGTDMYGEDIAGHAGYAVASALKCRDDCAQRADCHGFVVDNCTAPVTCWLKGGNAATKASSCRCYGKNMPKPVPVNPMEQVEKYISYILSHQDLASGWLGPPMSGGGQYWGPSNVLQALYMYAEGSKDAAKFNNVSQAVLMHMLESKRRMAHAPLSSWAKARWIDLALTAEWLIDNPVDGAVDHKQDLIDMIGMLHDQGSNWEEWFEHFTGDAGGHNVNNAQGLKSAAVLARYNSSFSFEGHSSLELSLRRMQHLDSAYGLPTGMYNGDEILPSPATRSPSRGIEVCGVVEAMFSYNVMFSVHGDPAFAERAERIAYNAMPATWASPKGGDMWAHQYLQAVNEINAIRADPHVWKNDGDMAETYGLEPNYGCCTANFNQGWPKFASMIFYEVQGGGVAVGLYAPASALLRDGTKIDIDTQYPYGDDAKITVTATKQIPVHLRIPSWASRATVNGELAANGTMWKGTAKEGTTAFTVAFNPAVRLEEWDGGAVSVHRGQLMYALPITPNYTVYAHHYGDSTMSNDYYLQPTTEWRYALDVKADDPRSVEQAITFAGTGYVQGSAPFNHSDWPSTLSAPLRSVQWGTALNSAAVPPTSPACNKEKATCGPQQQHKLVPYGGTELRIGEFPLAYTDGEPNRAHGMDVEYVI